MEQWTRAQDWAVQMLQDDPDRAAEILALQMGSDTEPISAAWVLETSRVPPSASSSPSVGSQMYAASISPDCQAPSPRR
jgi:hypothetical protein